MVTPPPIQLANLGMADSIILMILALVVFGPRRLPQIGRQIGKLMFEFRKASNDFKFQMEEELRAAEEADRRKKEEAERQRVDAIAAQSQASVSAPAQTVESTADIGAIEPTATSSYPEHYAPQTASAAPDPTEGGPVIQPPQTGEQVSASSPRPDYYFEGSGATAADSAAMTEVNPDADAEANAEGLAATSEPASAVVESHSPSAPGHTPENQSTPSKETVSQHG